MSTKEENIKQLTKRLIECDKKYALAKEKGDKELQKEMFNMRLELGYAIVALSHYEGD